jgi:hypothetical protein
MHDRHSQDDLAGLHQFLSLQRPASDLEVGLGLRLLRGQHQRWFAALNLLHALQLPRRLGPLAAPCRLRRAAQLHRRLIAVHQQRGGGQHGGLGAEVVEIADVQVERGIHRLDGRLQRLHRGHGGLLEGAHALADLQVLLPGLWRATSEPRARVEQRQVLADHVVDARLLAHCGRPGDVHQLDGLCTTPALSPGLYIAARWVRDSTSGAIDGPILPLRTT